MPDTSFCRLCALKNDNYVKVYEAEGEKLNLASKIKQCLQIWLYPEDVLPTAVCVDCCVKVDEYFDFFELCSESQISLMSIFGVDRKEEVDSKSEIVIISNDFAEENCNIANESDCVDEEVTDNLTICLTNDHNLNSDSEGNDHEDNLGDGARLHDNDERGTSRRKLRVPIKRTGPEESNKSSCSKINNNITKTIANKNKTNRANSINKKVRPIKNNTCKKTKSTSNISNRKKIIKSRNNYNGKKLCNIRSEFVGKNMKMCDSEKGDREAEEKLVKDEEEMSETGDESEDDGENNVEKLNPNKSVMENYNWKCTDCTVQLKTLSALKDHHLTVHNQPPNFECSDCSKVYTRYRSFHRHVKVHHVPKQYSCDVCGKCFSQKTVLRSHSTVHSDERPHVCPQCGKGFKQFSSLYLHSKCHLPDECKPKFPCTVCPKQFTTKHSLETHMKIHTGERNYICDVCGKSFIAKGSLDYHILAHNDAKPHNCPVCGKGFKTVRLLTKHSTLHTGIKPHQCDVCGKQFRERSALKEHNRIHTGAMPYSCEFCGKLFRFKGILTVHRRQHTGERPYGCTDCKRQFTNWANYNKHMKRRHRNVENNHQVRTENAAVQVDEASTQLMMHENVQTENTSQLTNVNHTLHQHLISLTQDDSEFIPPQITVQQLPPVNALQLHIQSPSICSDNTDSNSMSNSNSKLIADDHSGNVNINSDIFRVSHYVPTHTLPGMSYYIPPLHPSILHTRNQ